MSLPLKINVGSDHPLEFVLALVEAATVRDNRHWRMRFTPEAFKVIRESAFTEVSKLIERGQADFCEDDPSIRGLTLVADQHCCRLGIESQDPFARCVAFLRSARLETTTVEMFAAMQMARVELVTQVKAKAAILIGTGPSLTQVDLRAYQSALTFGCNKLHLLPYKFNPSHQVFEDRVVTEDIFRTKPDFGSATLWMPHDLAHLAPLSIRYCLDRVVARFPTFSKSDSIAYSGWTVMFVMLQMAYWMDVQEVYLVGVDGTYREPPHQGAGPVRTSTGPDEAHFIPNYYGPGSRYQKPDPGRVAAAYNLANTVYVENGRRITNCSVGSKIQSFSCGSLPSPEYFYAA